MYEILEKKKNNHPLTKEEIEFVIKGYVNSTIPDYQMSALLMAIVINGMTDEETYNLTSSMTDAKLDLFLETVDKHSTGGVGDKITLIVLPIVAALGCKVAKMSGRGLGYTGGTIDKLESIEGYNANLTKEQFVNQVDKINIALIRQLDGLCLADKKIYALRDVTATVDSIPLIVSSIMSKKIASGSKNLVIDVKVGSGSFIKDIEQAKILANKMVSIGKMSQINTVAVLTNMNIPLGNNIGNSLEVIEAIEILKNKGPEDLREVSTVIASYMYSITNNLDVLEARKEVEKVLLNGKAYMKFEEWIKEQGGNIDSVYATQKHKYEVLSDKKGYISKMNTDAIGKICVLLGSGRTNKNDQIDYQAGIILNKKTGDFVNEKDLLVTLYSSQLKDFDELGKKYLDNITIENEVETEKLIYDIIC